MKAAEAFRNAGYRVSIVCSSHARWLVAGDTSFLKSFERSSSVAHFDREEHPFSYYATGIRYRLRRRQVFLCGLDRSSLPTLGMAFTRPFVELVRLGVAAKADLYYGGTSGGIAVVAEIAKKRRSPYAIDLEDFHSAEQDPSAEAELSHTIIAEIERRVLTGARFLTCGSAAMAELYGATYGIKVAPIHNVFSLPRTEPDFGVLRGKLRLVWLGQTIGSGRGIEDAVKALGLANVAAELTLRGKVKGSYLDNLFTLARAQAPHLRIRHEEPDMSRSVVDLCRGYDIGLCLEQAHVLNRSVCLCNKPFTYLLAGLAVAFTDTAGQRDLARDLGSAALVFKVGDIKMFAQGLRHWAANPEGLMQAKRLAWQAAQRRWHWNHPEEEGRLLELVNEAFANASPDHALVAGGRC